MDVINIFLTSGVLKGSGNAPDEDLADFLHDGRRFTFDWIGESGPQRLADGPVWIFIAWMLDDLAGLELCRRLRADARTSEAHVTMVLDGEDPEDRRRALKAGADDYVTGPMTRNEVLDRVMALQSGYGDRRPATQIEIGELSIDKAALQARWGEQPINLRPNEFRLLRFFAEHPNRVLSRDDLINGLGKRVPTIDERTVDVWIGRLRRAIKAAGGGNPVRTVRSKGYVFDLE